MASDKATGAGDEGLGSHDLHFGREKQTGKVGPGPKRGPDEFSLGECRRVRPIPSFFPVIATVSQPS
jgi:hypothetical protein